MIGFEVSVNGRVQQTGDRVTTITLVAEPVRSGERVSLHLAAGDQYAAMDEPAVRWLNADLRAGDEIAIRIVDVPLDEPAPFSSCNFCGAGPNEVASLVCGPAVAICDGCSQSLSNVVVSGGQLPLGVFIRDTASWPCGFCGKEPGVVPGVFVRNGAAICPECLRAITDVQA